MQFFVMLFVIFIITKDILTKPQHPYKPYKFPPHLINSNEFTVNIDVHNRQVSTATISFSFFLPLKNKADTR